MFAKIGSTDEYGVFQKQQLTLTPKMEGIAEQFLNMLKESSSVLLFVNQRKVLLQQIYKNLYLQLKNYLNVSVEYIDSVKPGLFTNYQSSYFLEPQSVLVFLTKKHNTRQLRLLEELKKRNFKVHVIVLGTTYYHPQFNVVCVDKIRGLYWFMYSLLKKRVFYNYADFSKLFRFEPVKFDFKAN